VGKRSIGTIGASGQSKINKYKPNDISDIGTLPDIIWYDQNGLPPQWNKMGKVLVARINERISSGDFPCSYLLAFNASPEAVQICLPHDNEQDIWKRVIDTSFPPPHEIEEKDQPVLSDQQKYLMSPRSFILLISICELDENQSLPS